MSTEPSGRRAAQIQAVRAVLGWPAEADPELEATLNDEAGRLVDAVHAAGRDGRAEVERLRAEVEQFRYERRLLGVARMTLDLVAAGDPTRWDHARTQAEDVAQRIVDEIGHPVTDEPALGADLRAENARLAAELDEAREERAYLRLMTSTLQEERDQGEARGWAKAVQALRDYGRYHAWVSREPFRAPTSSGWLWHIADYLEAVGPDRTAGPGGEAVCANSYYAHGPHQWAELRTCPGWPDGQRDDQMNKSSVKPRPFVPCELGVAGEWCALPIGHSEPCNPTRPPAAAAETGQDGTEEKRDA